MSKKCVVVLGDFDFQLDQAAAIETAVGLLGQAVLGNAFDAPKPQVSKDCLRLIKLALAGKFDPRLIPLLEADPKSIGAACHCHKGGESTFLVLSEPESTPDQIATKLEKTDPSTFEFSKPDGKDWIVFTPSVEIYDLRGK